MDRLLILISLIALMMAMPSCDSREDVEGQWQCSSVPLSLPNATSSSNTLVITFTQDGKASINSDIIFTEQSPYATDRQSLVSVSALASIDGVWRYVSDGNDEVEIVFDNSSFAIDVAPSAVNFSTGISDNDKPSIEHLRSATIAGYASMLTDVMRRYFAEFSHLDDIKVTKGQYTSLSFETEDSHGKSSHFTFHPI